jgi:RNA polymerase sigma-70 factor, ECF subfamily
MATCRSTTSSPAAGRAGQLAAPAIEQPPRLLDPERLPDHIDAMYRAARAMCGSRHDAEDLVQETLEMVLRRPRWIRTNELGYLLRALRHNYATRVRNAARRPVMLELFEHEASTQPHDHLDSREIMRAIAALPEPYRDAVVAVDVVGLSYREAARSLRTREATLTTRLHRGRQRLARVLLADAASAD